MIGRQVAQYQLLEKLGVGGMGEIFKAQDTRLNRTVAIKVLPSARAGDPERRTRFLLEAQAASSLNHPSIITIHDVLSEGDTEFMVMNKEVRSHLIGAAGVVLVKRIELNLIRPPRLRKFLWLRNFFLIAHPPLLC